MWAVSLCDALRIVNAFTHKHAQACAPTHKHTHTHSESRATSVKGTCWESCLCYLAHRTNRVLRYGARRLFNMAFSVFKCHKISRHTRKCYFIYTHIEYTAFLTPRFTKSINSHYHYVHILQFSLPPCTYFVYRTSLI